MTNATGGGEPAAPRPPRTLAVGPCPICDRAGAVRFLSSEDRLLGVPGTFLYRRCHDCGTVFQDPRVVEADVGLLYPGGYYTRSSRPAARSVSSEDRGAAGFRDRLRRGIRRVVAPDGGAPPGLVLGRIPARSRWLRERAFFDLVPDEMLPWRSPAGRGLDVGCGNGDLMLRLEAVGWDMSGLEVDSGAADLARERTGRPVHVGDILSLDARDLGTFELVTLSHVFEHLVDPVGALRILSSLLAAGGRIVLVYPNPESLGARLFGRHWFAWDPPRHLVLPPLRATLHLARTAGLRCRSARTLARWGAGHSLHSRSYRRGEGPSPGEPDLLDRAFGGLERMLMVAGPQLGEEIIISLERRR